ncbi:hypothetical protein [Streptomyces sp. HPF1205]|uniref:hypothetical protein n=1 Tax=Streptomyces sp. HPF1205 TaxID=2873262 RepID=UPI001CED9C2E|nr:hypothetical protein [Streptomyces sp. HPF1205]
MSTGAVIAVVVVAAVVVCAIAAAMAMMRGGGSTMGVKRRFGPEYERALARNDGDVKATRRELSERVKRFGGLRREPLSAQDRDRYMTSWAGVQTRFVDEPAAAVNEADRLLAGLAAERGFPGADSPDHFNALSVHHPHEIQGYRHAHALAEHGPVGRQATEELRQALLGARALFDVLVEDVSPEPVPAAGTTAPVTAGAAAAPSLEKGPEADGTRGADPAGTADPDAADREEALAGGPGRRGGPLAQRFAGLTGGRRGGHGGDQA